MTVYTRDEPVATDNLSTSVTYLTANTNAADTDFGKDHYAFSDSTANNGLHKQVTSVPQNALPVTAANPILVAFQPYAAIGAIQYSCGPSAAFPTPLTKKQSPSAAIPLSQGATTDVLNFSGITRALFRLTAADYSYSSGSQRAIFDAVTCWNGSTFVTPVQTNTILSIAVSGTQLKLQNISLSAVTINIYWTLEFLRIN